MVEGTHWTSKPNFDAVDPYRSLPSLVNNNAVPVPHWTNVTDDTDTEMYEIVTIQMAIERRVCVNCTRVFTPPIISAGRASRGRPRFSVSDRMTCSTLCEREYRGGTVSGVHADRKAADPDAYIRSLTRPLSFSAMGKRRHTRNAKEA